MSRGERRCIRTRRKWSSRVTEKVHTGRSKCVAVKNRKAAGVDQIVNEFIKYDGEEMITMIVMLYSWTWKKEDYAPKKWREGEVGRVSGLDVCRLFRGDIGNTRRIAETNRESTRIY